MKKILNITNKIAISWAAYTFIIMAIADVFPIDQNESKVAYLCLQIGALGIGVLLMVFIEATLSEVLEKFVSETGEDDSEQLLKIMDVFFSVGVFSMFALAGYGVMITVHSVEWVNTFDLKGYTAIMLFALVMCVVYKKWNYPQQLKQISTM